MRNHFAFFFYKPLWRWWERFSKIPRRSSWKEYKNQIELQDILRIRVQANLNGSDINIASYLLVLEKHVNGSNEKLGEHFRSEMFTEFGAQRIENLWEREWRSKDVSKRTRHLQLYITVDHTLVVKVSSSMWASAKCIICTNWSDLRWRSSHWINGSYANWNSWMWPLLRFRITYPLLQLLRPMDIGTPISNAVVVRFAFDGDRITKWGKCGTSSPLKVKKSHGSCSKPQSINFKKWPGMYTASISCMQLKITRHLRSALSWACFIFFNRVSEMKNRLSKQSASSLTWIVKSALCRWCSM